MYLEFTWLIDVILALVLFMYLSVVCIASFPHFISCVLCLSFQLMIHSSKLLCVFLFKVLSKGVKTCVATS
jgi:hypothetical protein